MQLYHKTTSGSVSAVAFLFQVMYFKLVKMVFCFFNNFLFILYLKLSSSNNSNMDSLLDLVSFESKPKNWLILNENESKI